MDHLLLLDFILYMFFKLAVFFLWPLELLLSLRIWTSAQKQVDIAKQDKLREQTIYNDNNKALLLENKSELYDPDQEKQGMSYFLQFKGHEQTIQCFTGRYLTEEFIQVDPLLLDSLQGLYVNVEGTQEETVQEQDGLENVQWNSLTESDIEADETQEPVLRNNIPSGTLTQNGRLEEEAQTLLEQLRIETISIQQCSSTPTEHTGWSEFRYSSGAEDNVSASDYNSGDNRRVLDNHITETEAQSVGQVRVTNTACMMRHDPCIHQNVMIDDNPLQPADAVDIESTVSNLTPFDIDYTSFMSMSTSTLSRYFSSMSSEESEAFVYEWIRLKTFSDWPLNSIFSTVLARNGWVSLGDGDKARCYSCHVVHEWWRIGDDPDQYHSPKCRFKSGQANNVPISRGNSSQTHPMIQFSLLSTQGDGSSDNNPETVQGLNRPQQDSLSTETSLTKEKGEISSAVINGSENLTPNQQSEPPSGPPVRLKFGSPKYPSYASPAVRIGSFIDWPAAMTHTPRDMALAGFFYAGYGDSTICFFCGGGLRNWEAGNDPWVEHARWFMNCPFVQQNRGQEFIDLVQKLAAELDEQGNQEGMGNSQTNTAINQQALHSNADSHLDSNIDDQASFEEHNTLLHTFFAEPTSQRQENTSLNDQIMCKICMEKNVSIAFLPCGHLACCEDCAPAMRKCPICWEFVRGTVKTFIV